MDCIYFKSNPALEQQPRTHFFHAWVSSLLGNTSDNTFVMNVALEGKDEELETCNCIAGEHYH